MNAINISIDEYIPILSTPVRSETISAEAVITAHYLQRYTLYVSYMCMKYK